MRFADLPQIEGATGRFMLNQMAAVAELEAGLISARTKAALARKRRFYAGLSETEKADLAAQGRATQLGGHRGGLVTDETRKAARAAVEARTGTRTADLAPVIAAIRAAGITSARGIAKALTDRGIGTARGGETWTTTQVSRLLARIGA